MHQASGQLAGNLPLAFAEHVIDRGGAIAHQRYLFNKEKTCIDCHMEREPASKEEYGAKAGKIASLVGMEGGHSIDSSLAALRMLYLAGARYMTITHSKNNDWADSATADPVHNGLTPFGKVVIGVGVKNSTSDLLIANCDEFIYYDDLVRVEQVKRRPTAHSFIPFRLASADAWSSLL